MRSSSLFSSVLFSGQAKLGSGFHTGHSWFLPSEGKSSCVCFWVPFFLSNLCRALLRPTKICFAFLQPASQHLYVLHAFKSGGVSSILSFARLKVLEFPFCVLESAGVSSVVVL